MKAHPYLLLPLRTEAEVRAAITKRRELEAAVKSGKVAVLARRRAAQRRMA